MSGYFGIQRGWSNNPAFNNNPMRKLAWVYLCEKAAFKNHSVAFKGTVYNLKRGQLVTSIRDLSLEWESMGFTNMKTRSYLGSLKSNSLINTADSTHGTVITICNYCAFNNLGILDNTVVNTVVNTRLTHGQHTVNTHYNKGIKIIKKIEDITVKTKYTEEFNVFWFRYPEYRRKEKPKAYAQWKAALKQVDYHHEITDSLISYCKTKEVEDGFAPYPAKWLKNERWNEHFTTRENENATYKHKPEQTRLEKAMSELTDATN